jgi:hypothetical protein
MFKKNYSTVNVTCPDKFQMRQSLSKKHKISKQLKIQMDNYFRGMKDFLSPKE